MLTMYDSVTTTEIPANAAAVAGYVNGRWPTFASLKKSHPKALRLSIAVTASADADCLDVEKGDAEVWQAPDWVRRQQKRGVKRPVLYTSLSQVEGLLAELRRAGIGRDQVRLWTAHYTHGAHLCAAGCGFGLSTTADATQYTDRAEGRNLDASLVSPGFFTVPVSAATRRARLRAWILGQRKNDVAWATLKKTANWKLWRKLGGR
jgi:hypothetical protein